MFTGLIRDIGTLEVIEEVQDGLRVTVSTGLPYESYIASSSVCCSGVCLTVTRADIGHFQADISAETLSKTVLGQWKEKDRINLEPSLKLGDELGGHLVFGHVDDKVELVSLKEEGESWRLKFKVSDTLKKYIASKGSVSINGISLTVNEVEDDIFGVNIIPYTWHHTTLSDTKIGDFLNIEIDMLARYVARALEGR